MMKNVLIILIAATATWACFLAAQTVTPPTVEQKVIAVPGSQSWTKTGFTLGPGDRVTMKASGKVYFSDRPGSSTGPSGWPGDYKAENPNDFAACVDPLPKENHACLIARVNEDKFKVGSSLTFSGKAGELYLGINDCTLTGDYGNTGVFGVNIKVERDAVPLKK